MVWKERLYYANKALKTSSYFQTTKLTLTIWMEYSIAIFARHFRKLSISNEKRYWLYINISTVYLFYIISIMQHLWFYYFTKSPAARIRKTSTGRDFIQIGQFSIPSSVCDCMCFLARPLPRCRRTSRIPAIGSCRRVFRLDRRSLCISRRVHRPLPYEANAFLTRQEHASLLPLRLIMPRRLETRL